MGHLQSLSRTEDMWKELCEEDTVGSTGRDTEGVEGTFDDKLEYEKSLFEENTAKRVKKAAELDREYMEVLGQLGLLQLKEVKGECFMFILVCYDMNKLSYHVWCGVVWYGVIL